VGKAYVLRARSSVRVKTIGAEFISRVKMYPFRRKAEMSGVYQKPNDEWYRVIIDVCGTPSAEIDSIHAAIQESEEY
jgi:hypothetical protein